MDEQQLQQQIAQLVQAAMQGDELATQLIQQIMLAAQQGDLQATQLAQMIQYVALQMQQQQVLAAKFGAKLNYIRSLRGQCPDGYEMQYFKQGGPMGTRLCKLCVAKQKKMEESGKTPSNSIDAFKCGRKMKKKENGGNIDFSKCGSKMKKKACGGSVKEAKCGTKVEMDKCGKKMKKKACGGSVERKKSGGKQRRPFTGFEGLSYSQTAARPSFQGRASRPQEEEITNNGKMIMGRETWYDPATNQPEDTGYYPGYDAKRNWKPTDTIRTFDFLKRHALNY